MTEPCNPHPHQQPSSLDPGASGIPLSRQKNAGESDLCLLKTGTSSIISCTSRTQGCAIFACRLNALKFHSDNLKRCKNVIKSCQPIVNYSGPRLEGGCEEIRFLNASSLCCLAVAIILSNPLCLGLQGLCA